MIRELDMQEAIEIWGGTDPPFSCTISLGGSFSGGLTGGLAATVGTLALGNPVTAPIVIAGVATGIIAGGGFTCSGGFSYTVTLSTPAPQPSGGIGPVNFVGLPAQFNLPPYNPNPVPQLRPGVR